MSARLDETPVQDGDEVAGDVRSDLHRGEARAGNPAKFLLLAVGLAALWYANGGQVEQGSLLVCLLYAVVSILLLRVFAQAQLPAGIEQPLVLASYAVDLLYVTFLVSATGGPSSDLYVLYGPLALKAAVYYPALPPLLLMSYLIAPLYALALRLAAGGWFFLLDPVFAPRYVMLFALITTAMYMSWLFERRQIHISQLTRNLNAKAEVLEHTATGLGDRLIELRTLQEGIKAINSALALEDLLHQIAVNASQVLGVAQCLVALLDEQSNQVVPRAASGLPTESLSGERFRLGSEVATMVVRTGRPILIADVRADARFSQTDDLPVVSVMSAPLLTDNRPVGALTATSRKRGAFEEQDLNLLAAFADQAAIAVKNAALYQRLTAEKRRTEAIIQGLGDGVIVTDAQYGLALLNPVAATVLGLSRTPLTGAPVSDFIESADLMELLRSAVESDPKPVVREIALSGPRSDQKRVFHVLATTVNDEAGAVRNIVAVLRDITSRKEVEEMKSNFLSVVSHELKTPLHSIKGFVDIILMGKAGQISDTQRDFLSIVKTQTTQLQNQINDLLEFSRLEAGQIKLRIENVNIAEVTTAVVDKLRLQAQDGLVDLHLAIASDLPTIQADRGRVEQVLTNLVDNAIKFTPSGGKITVSGEDQGMVIMVAVSDTGIGIPTEALERVFDRFYQVDGSPTRSYRGTGLGLTICRHIVEQHGGSIWVESEAGKGAVFRFTLPKELTGGDENASLDFAAFPSSLTKG